MDPDERAAQLHPSRVVVDQQAHGRPVGEAGEGGEERDRAVARDGWAWHSRTLCRVQMVDR